MATEKKESKPLKVWIEGKGKLPFEYKSSIEFLKEGKEVVQNATSASIEIIEKVDTEGSNLSNKDDARLRNWAINEIQALQKSVKQLQFMDVKYKPKEYGKRNYETGEVKEYPARLVFRVSNGKSSE